DGGPVGIGLLCRESARTQWSEDGQRRERHADAFHPFSSASWFSKATTLERWGRIVPGKDGFQGRCGTRPRGRPAPAWSRAAPRDTMMHRRAGGAAATLAGDATMQTLADRAAEALARHPAPALSLDELVDQVRGDGAVVGPEVLLRALEARPDLFRVLD